MSYEASFQKLPKIDTPRLILRQIRPSILDSKDSLEFINDYSMCRYWGLYDDSPPNQTGKRPTFIHKTNYHYYNTMDEYLAGNELSWLLELKDSQKVIGEIVLYDFKFKKQADLGYRINKKYWNQGFASEAGHGVIKFAFEYMNLVRLQIRCHANNPASKKVAQNLNFRKEGFIKKGAIINTMEDYYIFGYLKDDYKKRTIDKAYTIIG